MTQDIFFNHDQLRAIAHGEGPALVLAGPGSGKTAVITERIHRLIQKENAAPDRILVLTFTRSAALEMRKRYEKKCGITDTGVVFGTFHSFFFKILRSIPGMENISVIGPEKQIVLMKKAIDRLQSAGSDNFIKEKSRYLSGEIIRECCSMISGYISGNREHKERMESSVPGIGELCRMYRDVKRDENAVDYNDMALISLERLKADPDLADSIRKSFDYILLDEFQDINGVQYEIMSFLEPLSAGIFAVGDDDQAIYGFRGASPEYMKRFMKDHQGAAIFCLTVNYRSGSSITEAAGRVIAANRNRMNKKIVSGTGKRGRTEIIGFPDRKSELAWLSAAVRSRYDGHPCSIAVLVRTNRELGTVKNALKKSNILPDGATKEKKSHQLTITLSTFHGSKGLEFDVVFLPGLTDAVLPDAKAVTSEDIEEERRMFYVAMTRARDALIMTYHTGDGGRKRGPSSFLRPVVITDQDCQEKTLDTNGRML